MSHRTTSIFAAAAFALAASLAASAADAASPRKSPFCFAGSPTPKYICDTIKANQKPKPGPKRVRHETAKTVLGTAPRRR